MKSSYITETHNEIEKNYYYNIKNKEKKKIFLAVNVSVFQPFRSFIVIIINSNYMDSQFSDIRKEYKKGKLTRNTISENPSSNSPAGSTTPCIAARTNLPP